MSEENNLTKQQAIEAMRLGKKITHIDFTDNEWMIMRDNEIILEDGVRYEPEEFWRYRTAKAWDSGYYEFINE